MTGGLDESSPYIKDKISGKKGDGLLLVIRLDWFAKLAVTERWA